MMEMRNERRLYSDLAKLWHLVSPLEDYLEETEIFCDYVKKASQREKKSLLHLGCGRGHNDYVFKRHFEVTGIDISSEMLEWAHKLNPEIDYRYGDIRSFRLEKRFDVVTAVDSVDYLLNAAELKSFFSNAYFHLNSGGVLMFILDRTKESFIQNDTMTYYNSKDDEVLTVIENCFDPDEQDTEYELSFVYLYRKAGKLKIYTDRHLCGLFSLEEVRVLLENTGFDVQIVEYLPPESAVEDSMKSEDCLYPLFLAVKR